MNSDKENNSSVIKNPLSREQREMKIENKINIYRGSFILLFLVLLLLLPIYFNEAFSLYVRENSIIWVFIASTPLVFLIHWFTKGEDFIGWIKYLTLALDCLIVFFIGMQFLKADLVLFGSKTEINLLISLALIVVNSLSALRWSRSFMLYSSLLTLFFNGLFYTIQEAFFYTGLITTAFIMLHSFIILRITNHLLNYNSVNNELYTAYGDLKKAHDDINQKNEEITVQSELIMDHVQKLEEIQKDHTDSLIYAQKIQRAVINNDALFDAYFKDHFIYFQPKNLVTGDFYWISKAGDKLIIAVSDCTGHGVPGAFMTMLGYSFLNEIVNKENIIEPDIILNELRKNIISTLHQEGKIYEQKDGMDMSIVQIDRKKMRIKFAAANNSLCYIPERASSESKKVLEFKGDRMPISFHYKMRHFSLLEFDINEGDKFYIYTDGYIDQFGGPKGKKFKSVPFRRMLLNNHNSSMPEQKSLLKKTMDNWLNETYEQVDDITVIGFEI